MGEKNFNTAVSAFKPKNKGENNVLTPIPMILVIIGICGSMKSKIPFIAPPSASKNPARLSFIGAIISLNALPIILKYLPIGSVRGFNILPIPPPTFPPRAPPAAPSNIPPTGPPIALPNIAPPVAPSPAPVVAPSVSGSKPSPDIIDPTIPTPKPSPAPSPNFANLLR